MVNIKSNITGHMMVRNEDQFIRFAVLSVLPFLDQLIIFDTGSTDNTVQIIKSFNTNKIILEEKGIVTPVEYTKLRQEMIDRTKTEFFILIDGDEIWPEKSLSKLVSDLKTLPKEKVAVYCRTRNAVGDIYHYLPEEAGGYKFQGKKGNFAMRGFRKATGLTVEGTYPLEIFKFQGRALNDWDDRLFFSDTWYLHVTHLKRSSSPQKIAGFRAKKMENGILLENKDLPEVFKLHPQPRRSKLFDLIAMILTPLKEIKRYAKV